MNKPKANVGVSLERDQGDIPLLVADRTQKMHHMMAVEDMMNQALQKVEGTVNEMLLLMCIIV